MTAAMIASGETVSFGDARPAHRRQALDGRRGGRGHARVRAARGRARARRRQALRSWARPHGRNARQAGVDPRACAPTCRLTRSRRRSRRRLRRRGAISEPRPRRRRALRAARRDRHGAVDRADRGERDVEEARRQHRSDRARRQGGIGRVHEDAGRSPRARPRLSRPRGRSRTTRARVGHRHVAAARRPRSATRSTSSKPCGSCEDRTGAACGDLCVAFAARALIELEGASAVDAERRAEDAIGTGAALERFRRMVEAQGGDPRVVDDPAAVLPAAPVRLPIGATEAGTLAAVDAEAIGLASGALGAGRQRKGDPVDPAVGIVFTPKIGDRLDRGRPDRRGACADARRCRRGRPPGACGDDRRRPRRRTAAARDRRVRCTEGRQA